MLVVSLALVYGTCRDDFQINENVACM